MINCEDLNIENIKINIFGSNGGPVVYEIYNTNNCCGEIIQTGTLDCYNCDDPNLLDCSECSYEYLIIPTVVIPEQFSIKVTDPYGCETCICAILPTPTLPLSPTPTRTPTNTPTPSFTPTPSPTATVGLTPTATPQPTPTPTNTPTGTPQPTPTPTNTPTITPTNTVTPTGTPQQTNTPTPTPTLPLTLSPTPTQTMTPTRTQTPTSSNTPTRTPTQTPTRTQTPTPTPTPTPTSSSIPSSGTNCEDILLDIVFINDESGSINSNNYYTHIVPGIKSIIQNLESGINASNIRIAIFGFSGNVFDRLNLSSNYNSIITLLTGNNLPYDGGGTATAGGLYRGFSKIINDNRNVKTKFFLITDGDPNACVQNSQPFLPVFNCLQSQAKDNAVLAANKIKETIKGGSNIELYTIGVTNSVDNNWLKNNIATSPTYHFEALTFQDFQNISTQIQPTICDNTPVDPQPTGPVCYTISIRNASTINGGQILYIESKLPNASLRSLMYSSYAIIYEDSIETIIAFCSEIYPNFKYGQNGELITPSGDINIQTGVSCTADNTCII